MINGRRTAKSMSAFGGGFEGGTHKGEHYSINTRTSLTGGYTADMGEAYTAMIATAGESLGGLDGQESAMKGWGTTKTVYNGVMDTIDVVSEFTPIGKAAKTYKGIKGMKNRTISGESASGGEAGGALAFTCRGTPHHHFILIVDIYANWHKRSITSQ
ncbi:hypothetical protein [Helicobacter sp. 13S00482-2]|uniref:hypothetical protein n=1 Tax=Helicobacter sp. 13S00482-2 TaxID=1476200 RepID=UPI001C5EE37D|nr:hypothetical protein [Helicobacter sp. 13S00482-2]